MVDRISAPVPANGASLNVSQVHSARRMLHIESSCSARHKGKKAFQSCITSSAFCTYVGSALLCPLERHVAVCRRQFHGGLTLVGRNLEFEFLQTRQLIRQPDAQFINA